MLLVFASAAQAASRKPDLKTAGVAASATSLPAGGTLAVAAIVRNAGVRKAGRSMTGFFLSRDARRSRDDVRFGSPARTRALKPGKRTKVSRTAAVPAILSGSFRLLACADVGKRVRERRESNNCRAAKAGLFITPPALPRPPTAVGASVLAVEDTPWVIVLDASDPDTCDLGFGIRSAPAHGRLTLLTPRPCIGGSDTATVVY